MASSASTSSSGASTPKLTDSLKRKLQVYVEIPPSPLHTSQMVSNKSNIKRKLGALGNPAGRKSGTPLSSKVLNHNIIINDTTESPLKKPKLIEYNFVPEKKLKKAKAEPANTDLFPNGVFYCHQCHRKIDKLLGLRCTMLVKGDRCKAKYCKPCLENRYGTDVEIIKRTVCLAGAEFRSEHVSGENYIWKCPKCADNCNCFVCRKAKGLPSIGSFKLIEETTQVSSASVLGEDSMRVGHLPGSVKAAPTGTSRRTSKKGSKINNASAPIPGSIVASTQTIDDNPAMITAANTERKLEIAHLKPKPRMPRAKKDVPEPKWTKVPTTLKLAEAEDRFFLREFLLRFSPIMKVSAKHLEDLDEFDVLSDACAKAIIMELLSLIAADAELEIQRPIKSTIKSISSGGGSPSSLWTNLSSLRDSLPPDVLCIPEPTSPSIGVSRTRTTHSISQTIQLVPVIIGLVEAALQGASAREEIETGAEDAKKINRDYYAATREENERWATERQNMPEGKEEKPKEKETKETKKRSKEYQVAYKKHKTILVDLDNEHTLKMQACAPRFQPLGRDAQGRVYYVSTSYKNKKVPSAEERTSLKKWGWLLAVWGKVEATSGRKGKRVEDGTEDEDDEEDHREERWWGFSDPAEIKKLAKWISAKEKLDIKNIDDEAGKADDCATRITTGSASGTTRTGTLTDSYDTEECEVDIDARRGVDLIGVRRTPSKNELKNLVKGLNEYAEFLAWRCDINLSSKGVDIGDVEMAEKGTEVKGKMKQREQRL